MKPDEVPEELHQAPAPTRRARTWDHLPEPRTTRSKRKVFITAVEVRRSGEDELTFAIKVAAAKTSGPAVHEALRSPMREGWVDAMASELDTIDENRAFQAHLFDSQTAVG